MTGGSIQNTDNLPRVHSARLINQALRNAAGEVATLLTRFSAAHGSTFLKREANRRRIKIWGTAEVVEDDPELLANLIDQDYKAAPEQAIVFKVAAWDVNCPQHIPRKFGEQEISEILEPFKARIAELEDELSKQRTHSESRKSPIRESDRRIGI